MKALGLCVVMVSTVLTVSSAWADSLYRCEDGTFTNKVERQCPLYEPKEIGRVQSKPNGEQQPYASVTLFQEQSKKH
jgi:hypothetical protein